MAIGQITSPITWLLGTVVPPAWLQSVQDNINGFLAGTDSILGLVLDGVGGQSSSPVAGGLTVTASAGGTLLPTPAFTRGVTYVQSPPFLLVHGSNSGGIYAGINVTNAVRNSVGNYTITLNTAIPTANTHLVLTGTVHNGGIPNKGIVTVNVTSSTTVTVLVCDLTGTAQDYDYHLIGFAI